MAIMLWPESIFANSVWDVLVEFGFTGTWAFSCKIPADQMRYRQTPYEDQNGHARVKVDFGINYEGDAAIATYAVDSARILTPTELELWTRSDDPEWRHNGQIGHVIYLKDKGRIRAFQSWLQDGTQVAKDGIYLYNHKRTPWMERCSP